MTDKNDKQFPGVEAMLKAIERNERTKARDPNTIPSFEVWVTGLDWSDPDEVFTLRSVIAQALQDRDYQAYVSVRETRKFG